MASVSRQTESERQILRLLVRGEQEMAEGRGIDLDTVLAEAEELRKKLIALRKAAGAVG